MSNGLTFELDYWKIFSDENSRENFGYLSGNSKIGLAKFHENRMRINKENSEKHVIQVNVTASGSI